MKILFIVPYPLDRAPSQRFRFEQYFETLRRAGHSLSVRPFLSPQAYKTLQSGASIERFAVILLGMIRRPAVLIEALYCDFVFIHREAAPVGPPVLEWIISVVLGKKMIYDFDDAIWLTDKTSEGLVERALRWRGKVKAICRWSYKVSCGNRFLAAYASQFNPRTVLNPTTVDTVARHNPSLFHKEADSQITILWTGSSTTLKYLNLVEPVLQKLEREFHSLRFVAIADQPPALKLERMEFVSWSTDTEVQTLSMADIGIMPLTDDDWSRGKCGFKALQYMAMEIPVVASAVGANLDIITHGVSGFLAKSENDWVLLLRQLILEKDLREAVGRNGRLRVEQHYSVTSNESNFISLFE